MADATFRIPAALRERADEIIAVTDVACHEHLDDEYGAPARRLLARLARKRPSPLVRGDVRVWAAGVIYVLGQVTSLRQDRVPARDHRRARRASRGRQVDVANKAALINRTLPIGFFEPELTGIAMLEQHPLAWLVEVDGHIVDARTLPPDLQDEARHRGLIPDLNALRYAA